MKYANTSPNPKSARRAASPSAVAALVSGIAVCAAAASSCQTTFPVKETNPYQHVTQCLAPAEPMATLRPAQGDGFPSAACVERARGLVAKLSRREKFGQMMQPDRGTIRTNDDLARLGIGSLLSGGGSAPSQNTAFGWARMVNEYREHSLKAPHAIPLIYGVDAVHGHNNVRGAVIFPHNVGLGATRDADLVERIGRATAREVRATNIDWTFAPVLAVARDERWGRTYEAFGEAPELPELLGPALIRGLQGQRLGREPHSVLACAKHFIGDGHTLGGVDQGNSPLSPSEIEALLPAYRMAIEAGVGSMMVSYSSVDGIKMHCHGPLLNDTLKGQLGFNGLLVSDWEAIEKLPGTYVQQLTAAINAGIDMVMAPKVHTGFVPILDGLVPDRIPMERIDDAVSRILTVKCELGMLEPDSYTRDRSGGLAIDAQLMEDFGGPAHRALAREAVQKSLVLLQNRGQLLPLSKDVRRVHLAGSGADDVGRQCGGWTISWQGETGDITPGTSVRAALESVLGPADRMTLSKDGNGAAGADVGIAVIGEKPYAEMNGDKNDLSLHEDDVATVRQLKAAGIPVVVILLSGRPMILGEVAELADAVVAAWLPGTEGAGITDALFGDVPFSGKLPHTWPRSMDQIPINVGDANYDPLFPYGYGLTTAARPAANPESPGAQPVNPPSVTEEPAVGSP